MITIYDNFLKPDEVRNIYDFLNMDDFVWNKIDDYRGQKVKRMSFGRTIRQPAIGEIMHDDPLVSYLHKKIKEKNMSAIELSGKTGSLHIISTLSSKKRVSI